MQFLIAVTPISFCNIKIAPFIAEKVFRDNKCKFCLFRTTILGVLFKYNVQILWNIAVQITFLSFTASQFGELFTATRAALNSSSGRPVVLCGHHDKLTPFRILLFLVF